MSTGQHVPFRAFNPYDEVRIARRRLPHWRQPGVSYLVTFRLADSLPQTLLRQWRNERGIRLRFGWTSPTITSFAMQKNSWLFATTSPEIRRKLDSSRTNIRYSLATC